MTDPIPGHSVFTFGIGSDASEELVRGLATAGNGFAEFVTADQPLMDAKSTVTPAYRLYSRDQLTLAHLTVGWVTYACQS
jgi:hypothetical protein